MRSSKARRYLFGALVDFKPSEARGEKREKFEPRGETGILAGYVLSTGMHWANKCRAWALTAFAGAELNIKKAKVPPRLRMPHQTERMILKSPLTFPTQQKYKAANETLEGIEMSVDAIGLDARDHLIEDEDYEPEFLQSDEKRLLDDEVDQIAGLLLDEGPEVTVGDQGGHVEEEDARPSSSRGKGKGDGHAKSDEEVVKPDLPHVSAGLPGDGVTYINNDGREVKIDKAGRPYPVGKDGFRLMKTTRLPEHTPDEWAMMRKYYTEEEKAEVKGGEEEEPKSKESEVSAPAETQTLQMPGGKRIRAMLRNRWGGVEWQYNWGLRKNVSKIKNPQEGKHLAELDWVRIVVNPVDGAVVLMDSKQFQDVLRRNVQLEKEFVCLVVIYAWKSVEVDSKLDEGSCVSHWASEGRS